jgi:hypothetical protein
MNSNVSPLKTRQERRHSRGLAVPAPAQGSAQVEVDCLPSIGPITVQEPPYKGAESDVGQLNTSDLTKAVLLDWLGQQPIMFHRVFVDITGNVISAIWLTYAVSSLTSDIRNAVDKNGLYQFNFNTSHCTAQTGLTSAEQKKCLLNLQQIGLLTKPSARALRAQVQVGINLQYLADRMLEHSQPLYVAMQQHGAMDEPLDVVHLQARSSARAQRQQAQS